MLEFNDIRDFRTKKFSEKTLILLAQVIVAL